LARDIAEMVEQASEARSAGSRSGGRVYGDGNFNGASLTEAADGLDSNARPTWGTQFLILSGRTFKNMYRNPGLLLAHYVISLLVAGEIMTHFATERPSSDLLSLEGMCGVLFWQVSNDLAGFQNRLGFFFFVCALFGFSCLSSLQVGETCSLAGTSKQI
jgi:hypothetical protein